ncbi:stressosome-associated protein Prli42 [Paenactinomyces guangxiensis]|uniref:Stressosome-associated protein Prli42 n=1 Tax=Paenactinomyces guangxiensis TaxID=1490290 RepID=A0A7W1WS94_9BACL|nr:stressosome-associated protein Prli42 [Paenactinomyces guangxiensis]MBH8592111.1 stressosome-associated protein Prli42 [Paenactinomyces guangxiensis]
MQARWVKAIVYVIIFTLLITTVAAGITIFL